MGGVFLIGKSLAAEGFAIFAAPAAWGLQLAIGYALTGYACYPRHVWRSDVAPEWAFARPLALAINLAALAVALVAGWTAWRLMAGAASPTPPTPARRRRFSGVCGLLASATFLAAVLANTLPLLGAPTC